MVFIVTVLLIIYIINNSFHSVYTYQYGWTVAFAFQSGGVAFGLNFAALFLLIWLFTLSFSRERVNRSNEEIPSEEIALPPAISFNWMIAPIINVFVVGGVNILYVYLYLQQSSTVIIVLQILLAMFKSFWNGLGYHI